MVNFQGDGRAIFKVFIGAIFALALIAVIANSISTQTTTDAAINVTVTAPEINETLDLTGRTLILGGDIINATNNTLTSLGMILQTGVGTSGLQSVQLILNDTAVGFNGTSVNVSYTYQPDGYLDNSGARSIAFVTLIFSALAIMVFVIVIFIKDGSLGNLIRGS